MIKYLNLNFSYMRKAAALNAKVKIQAKGCAEFDRLIYVFFISC